MRQSAPYFFIKMVLKLHPISEQNGSEGRNEFNNFPKFGNEDEKITDRKTWNDLNIFLFIPATYGFRSSWEISAESLSVVPVNLMLR